MAVIAYDFYDPADPDTLLGTLDDTQLKVMGIRPALFELGAGALTISRHTSESESGSFTTADLLQKGRLVRVRIPVVSEDAIWGFILKDGDFGLVSYREEGGEDLRFTGPGLLYMLSWGRLYEDWYAPGQLGRGSTTAQEPGQWIWLGEPYGAILTRIIEEGEFQDGGPLQNISHDFTREEDSDGNPWDVIAKEFRVPTGTDMLTVADRLAAAGNLYLELTPDLVLHARQSVGRNLTGSFGAGNVRFEKGVNLATELTRKTRKDHLTHLITRDADELFALHEVPGFSGQAKYGYLDVPQSNDPTYVATVAQQALTSSATESEEYALEITPGNDETAGLYLFGPEGTNGHFYLGDSVTAHTGTGEHDLNAASQRVIGCRITVDQASDDSTDDAAYRSLHIVPELSYRAAPNFDWRTTQEEKGATGDPGYCCGPRICTGTTVEGGEGILAFDWETSPDFEETIPAIPSISQTDHVLAGSGTTGLHRISLARYGVATPTFGWFPAVPGTVYVIGFDHLIFAHIGGGEVGQLVVEWVSGSVGSFVPISTETVDFPRAGSSPASAAISVTAPTGATTARLYQGQAGAVYHGWHLHAITVQEGGTVVPCADGTVAAANHTHPELHSTHSVEELVTAETDTTLRLAPDGAGSTEWVAGGGGSHPDLAAHDALGLATDAELSTHAGAADPHTGYQKESEKGAASGYASLNGSTKVPLAELPTGTTSSTVALGDAAAGLDATHAAAADPHTGYRLESADHSHASTGLQGGTIDHGALTGLGDDDHPQYVTDAEHAAIDHGGIVGTSDWPTKLRVTADQDVTNNATPQASTHLTSALSANKMYECRFLLIFSHSSALAKARFRFDFTQTIGLAGHSAYGLISHRSSAGAAGNATLFIGSGTQWPASDQITDLPSAQNGLNNKEHAFGEFVIMTGGSADNITLAFANNAAGVANTTRLHIGSYLWIREL